MQRPAKKLALQIQRIQSDKRLTALGPMYRYVSIGVLADMLKLAKSIDARMRLDGSLRSRQKKPAKSGVKP